MLNKCAKFHGDSPSAERVKGEVWAICRFWVFDGNGLLGHRLVDSRWFEKNPPTKSGWKRRSKKNAHVPVFRAEMIVTQYVLSSLRHLVTPSIYIHFCVWLGLFVDRWWLKEVWHAPDFLSNCGTRVPLAAPGMTRSPSKRICRGTRSQKTRNWPTCKPVHVHERSRKRRRSFDPAQSVDNFTQYHSRSLASEARSLDAHIHDKLGSTLSPLTKKHIPRRPCCSLELNRRATVPSRESELVCSSSFAKKNNEEVTDQCHASKYWLFATFARLFSSPRVSSRCLSSFASRRRPLGLRQRSFRTAGCRSGVDLDDLREPRKTTKRC